MKVVRFSSIELVSEIRETRSDCGVMQGSAYGEEQAGYNGEYKRSGSG